MSSKNRVSSPGVMISPPPVSVETSMRQCAHSTRSIGTGSGDRAWSAQPTIVDDAIISAIIGWQVFMIISPHVAFEHPFVAAQLERPRRIRFDPAVAEQHRPGREVANVGRNVCGEQ